jgi:hypothetical protein
MKTAQMIPLVFAHAIRYLLPVLCIAIAFRGQNALGYSMVSPLLGPLQESDREKNDALPKRSLPGERVVVLDDIEELIAHPFAAYLKPFFVPPPANIHLGAVFPLDLRSFRCKNMLPTETTKCLAFSRERFTLKKVDSPAEQLKRIAQVEALSFFGCNHYSMDASLKIIWWPCRYVAHADFDRFPGLRESFHALDNWSPEVTARIDTIWIENTANFDRKGIPIPGGPLDREAISPVAVKVGNDLYLVEEMKYKNELYQMAAMSTFELPLAICSGKDAQRCTDMFAKEYLRRITAAFAKSPILASVLSGFRTFPNELWLAREYKDSHVLGKPYYEYSRYLISCSGRTNVYVRFVHVVTLSPNAKGIYVEADERQQSLYDDVIRQTSAQVLSETCAAVGAKIVDRICRSE